MEEPIRTPISDEEDSIDLIAIAKTLWNGRITILIALLVGAIFGVVVALSTPNVYTATSIMVPQTGGKSSSGLSSLASLAGVDLGMAESAELSPIIYPKIVNSIPFKLELMQTKVNFSKYDHPITLYDYFTAKQKPTILSTIKKYTIGLPGVILGSIRKKPAELALPKASGNQPIKLTKKQYVVINALGGRVSLAVEKKEGYISLKVVMPEALAAAQVALKAQELLQREITKFKVEKSQANLDFIQERYNVAKAEAEGYQVNIAVNTDRYKNLTSSVPQVSNTRLQTKYSIANTVYQELAKQLEQAKIQVKKDTPVFTIVEPVTIPSEKTRPSRAKILIIWLFLGGILGCCIVFGKKWSRDLLEKWRSEQLVN
jgi:LPS O-antigen subunit length determinant protein (WzzB/FepE family)